MKIFEISIKVFLLENIDTKETFTKIANFIDSGLSKNKKLLDFHNENSYKNYTFCSFYPIERSNLYTANETYTIRIRTVDEELANYFNEELKNNYNREIKGLVSEMRIISKRKIERIYSITPAVLKTEDGYWNGVITPEDFKERLKVNLIKKYNDIAKEKIDEDFKLIEEIKFDNRMPVPFNYKGRVILGDKMTIEIADNKQAQNLAYMSLGTGILEMNPRGAGYVNAK